MCAHATQAERSTAFLRSPWTTILLSFIVICSAMVVAGVLTTQINHDNPDRYRALAAETVAFTVNDAVSAAAGPVESSLARTLRALLKELLKQAIDQPGHLLIAGLPIVLSRYLTGAPWYGWPVIPLLAYREWLQWPSSRWWDPPLDWAFLALGVIIATWALGALRRSGEPDRHHPQATPLAGPHFRPQSVPTIR